MSAKRTSVDAVFGTEKLPQAGKQNHLGNRSEPSEPIEAKAEIQEQERGGESKRPSVKQHTAYLPIPVHEHLRKLAFEENRKIQKMGFPVRRRHGPASRARSHLRPPLFRLRSSDGSACACLRLEPCGRRFNICAKKVM